MLYVVKGEEDNVLPPGLTTLTLIYGVVVGVGVRVTVGVLVGVRVGATVLVGVLVLVGVSVRVGVTVRVGAGAITVNCLVFSLFVSFDSSIHPIGLSENEGSTFALKVKVPVLGAVQLTVIVLVAPAAKPSLILYWLG